MRRLLLPTALLATAPVLLAPQQTGAPAPAGLDLATWKTWDQHSRWVFYQDSVTARRATVAQWVAFLDQQDDFEMLEQLAIYGGFQQMFGKGMPGEVLHRRDSKQWMRVALWNIRQRDGHNMQAATNPLKQHPGRFLGWARKYKEVARLGGDALLKELGGHAPTDPGDQLRPLDPQVVILPFLDAPRDIEALEPGAAHAPRARYLHEVLRAVGAVSIAAQFDEPYRGKLLHLTRHPHPRLRRAAMLEFSEFPADKVPYQELLTLADDTRLDAEDRRVAMLAATYARNPTVYLRIHDVLADPAHPGFRAVVSRLAAVGDEYSLHVVDALDQRALDADARVAVAGGRRTLLAKLVPTGKPQKLYQPDVALRLQLAVHAQRVGHPGAEALRAWTEGYLREQLQKNPTLRTPLDLLARHPERFQQLPARDRQPVQEWARRLIGR